MEVGPQLGVSDAPPAMTASQQGAHLPRSSVRADHQAGLALQRDSLKCRANTELRSGRGSAQPPGRCRGTPRSCSAGCREPHSPPEPAAPAPCLQARRASAHSRRRGRHRSGSVPGQQCRRRFGTSWDPLACLLLTAQAACV